jgi:hypothetical protein
VRIGFADGEISGQNPIIRNTLGEMGIRLLFTRWMDETMGKSIASGWRGDRYVAFDRGGAVSIVWKSEWRSEDDALEFANGLRRYVSLRYGEQTVDREIVVETSGKSVLFIDAANEVVCNNLKEFAGWESGAVAGR